MAAAPLGVVTWAIGLILAVGVWHAVRVTAFLLAGRPWPDSKVVAAAVFASALGATLPVVITGRAPGPFQWSLPVAICVLAFTVMAALNLVIGAYQAVSRRSTPAGVVAALTAVLAGVTLWGSWGVFSGTVPVTDDLLANGSLLVFTSSPDDQVTITVTPSTYADDVVSVNVDAPGDWLLLVSGRWAGRVDGVAMAARPLTTASVSEPDGSATTSLRLAMGGSTLVLYPSWLDGGNPTQYQGHGSTSLRLTLDRPYRYEHQGHLSVVYGPIGCASGLTWELVLNDAGADAGSVNGWHVPSECTVEDTAVAPGADYVQASTRNQTIAPNVPAWVARSRTDSVDVLRQRRATLLAQQTNTHPDGTIEFPLVPHDPQDYPGGADDGNAITMPAQVWTAQSGSGTTRVAISQALAITGFGAGGALLVSFLLAAVRLLLRQERWLQPRLQPPGYRAGRGRRYRPAYDVTNDPGGENRHT